jgi:hypothetical protein
MNDIKYLIDPVSFEKYAGEHGCHFKTEKAHKTTDAYRKIITKAASREKGSMHEVIKFCSGQL